MRKNTEFSWYYTQEEITFDFPRGLGEKFTFMSKSHKLLYFWNLLYMNICHSSSNNIERYVCIYEAQRWQMTLNLFRIKEIGDKRGEANLVLVGFMMRTCISMAKLAPLECEERRASEKGVATTRSREILNFCTVEEQKCSKNEAFGWSG